MLLFLYSAVNTLLYVYCVYCIAKEQIMLCIDSIEVSAVCVKQFNFTTPMFLCSVQYMVQLTQVGITVSKGHQSAW